MLDEPFSLREGVRGESDLIYDDAPEAFRFGIRDVLYVLGRRTPKAQRHILCSALRVSPDPNNWSEPNVEDGVAQLLQQSIWYKLFDALERVPMHLNQGWIQSIYGPSDVVYYEEVNKLLLTNIWVIGLIPVGSSG